MTSIDFDISAGADDSEPKFSAPESLMLPTNMSGAFKVHCRGMQHLMVHQSYPSQTKDVAVTERPHWFLDVPEGAQARVFEVVKLIFGLCEMRMSNIHQP